MGKTTAISWTDHTFNPWIGCTKISAGCANCYAEALMDGRFNRGAWGPKGTRQRTKAPWRDALEWNRSAALARVRRRVFCASLADVFENHPALVPWRAELWDLIRSCPWLDWQLLTKRPENIAGMLPADWGAGWPHVWLGTSIENQEAADNRIPMLLRTPAAVRFLSCEPLLGPIDLRNIDYERLTRIDSLSGRHGFPMPHAEGDRRINWVIVGGESGPGYRPMDLAWARSLHEQCVAAGVSSFFKQTSGWRSGMGSDALGQVVQEFPR